MFWKKKIHFLIRRTASSSTTNPILDIKDVLTRWSKGYEESKHCQRKLITARDWWEIFWTIINIGFTFHQRVHRNKRKQMYSITKRKLRMKPIVYCWITILTGFLPLTPSVRIFVMFFDGSYGIGMETAKGDVGRSHRLGCCISKLKSRWIQKDYKHDKRSKMKNAPKKNLEEVGEHHQGGPLQINPNISVWITRSHLIAQVWHPADGLKKEDKKDRTKTTIRQMITRYHFSFPQKQLLKLK